MLEFSKEEFEYITSDYFPEDFIEKAKDRIKIRACNTENIEIFTGSYLIEPMNWGEFKTTLVCGKTYRLIKYYKSFPEYKGHNAYKTEM